MALAWINLTRSSSLSSRTLETASSTFSDITFLQKFSKAKNKRTRRKISRIQTEINTTGSRLEKLRKRYDMKQQQLEKQRSKQVKILDMKIAKLREKMDREEHRLARRTDASSPPPPWSPRGQ